MFDAELLPSYFPKLNYLLYPLANDWLEFFFIKPVSAAVSAYEFLLSNVELF